MLSLFWNFFVCFCESRFYSGQTFYNQIDETLIFVSMLCESEMDCEGGTMSHYLL